MEREQTIFSIRTETWKLEYFKIDGEFFYSRSTISGWTWKNAFGTEQGVRKHYQSASIDRRGTSTRNRGDFFRHFEIYFRRSRESFRLKYDIFFCFQYMKKQTAALREVNDSRLKIYEQLEVSIQDLERANHRLVIENTSDKKLIKRYEDWSSWYCYSILSQFIVRKLDGFSILSDYLFRESNETRLSII